MSQLERHYLRRTILQDGLTRFNEKLAAAETHLGCSSQAVIAKDINGGAYLEIRSLQVKNTPSWEEVIDFEGQGQVTAVYTEHPKYMQALEVEQQRREEIIRQKEARMAMQAERAQQAIFDLFNQVREQSDDAYEGPQVDLDKAEYADISDQERDEL